MSNLAYLLLLIPVFFAIRSIIQALAPPDPEVQAAIAQLGFVPCPDRAAWLEETIARIENNQSSHYDVQDLKRSPGEPAIYWYAKRHRGRSHDDRFVQEEILFPLRRPSAGGIALMLKPSSLGRGLRTRVEAAMAAVPSDTHASDLTRLEIPQELQDTNLVAALGPPGASLYDLVDSSTLSVVQDLGDAGGLFVQCRDAWCTIGGALGAPTRLRTDLIVASIRSLI